MTWPTTLSFLTATQATPVWQLRFSLVGRFEDKPLYVDLSGAQNAGDLALRNPRFLEAIFDLASPLHCRAKNDLAGDEVNKAASFAPRSGSRQLSLPCSRSLLGISAAKP
jgi:hypothetical protein